MSKKVERPRCPTASPYDVRLATVSSKSRDTASLGGSVLELSVMLFKTHLKFKSWTCSHQ